MHAKRRAAFAALAVLPSLYAFTVAADPFGQIRVASNRHEYHGRGCPIEVVFTGNINLNMPHPRGLTMNYFWERSDGAKSQVQVVHPQPNQHMLVVKEPWRLGAAGRSYDISTTLHVNSGTTHLRESSPVVHVDCR